VEQPVKFEMVINRTTARTLGITISNDLLLDATDVLD